MSRQERRKMKQYIATEQWCELSDKGQNRWNAWCEKHGHDVCYDGFINQPDIGKMIQFLDEHNKRFNFHLDLHHREKSLDKGFWKMLINEEEYYGVEKALCDVLFQPVKEILET